MNRPNKQTYFMRIAKEVSTRATCQRRKVGCVIIDRNFHIVATGHNGVPRKFPHCGELGSSCTGKNYDSGEGLTNCQSVHAEANALLQCSDVENIYGIFTTTFPCHECIKMILNTSCEFIAYIEDYSHDKAVELWGDRKRVKICL